jgi:signal transduction histidine kinase
MSRPDGNSEAGGVALRPSGEYRVLVVDDDEGLLILMGETLQSEGYEVETAKSAAEAVAWLSSHRPDLMLLDLKLRDGSGLSLVAKLRAVAERVPFVVVTGQGDEKVAVEVMKQGALDYVMKNSALLDLLPEVVRRALAAIEGERALAAAQQEILAISEREQRRIGQDLHDGLGQQLTAIELMTHSIRSDLEEERPDLAAQMRRLGGFLREAITQTRSLAHGLTAFMLDASGLQTALADLAQRTSAVAHVRCRFDCPTPVEFEEGPVAGHLYRIAQEAVSNALKHAEAREIVIGLRGTDSHVTLQITDDGRGLPQAQRSGQGIGLRVMQHRASAIGAELTVTSPPGQGVTVLCILRRRV